MQYDWAENVCCASGFQGAEFERTNQWSLNTEFAEIYLAFRLSERRGPGTTLNRVAKIVVLRGTGNVARLVGGLHNITYQCKNRRTLRVLYASDCVDFDVKLRFAGW